MPDEWKTRGIRGAITVEENSAEEINKATLKLLNQLISNNAIDKDEIVSVVFTLTNDLNAAFPAKTARIELGWNNVAMLCVHEIPVPDSINLCIRILVTVNTTLKNNEIKHIYLGRAKSLRPDLCEL